MNQGLHTEQVWLAGNVYYTVAQVPGTVPGSSYMPGQPMNEKQQKDVITAPPCTLGLRFIANEKSKNTLHFYNHCKCNFSISMQCFLQIASS